VTARAAWAVLRAAAAGGALVLALGCATDHGRFDFDPAASFAAYRTFAFAAPELGEGDRAAPSEDVARSPLTDERVRAALERALVAKGLSVAPIETANLLVAFDVSSRRATRTEVYPDGIAVRWPRRWWIEHWQRVYTEIYTEGLLVVDLIDAKTRRLAWRGWTADPLPRSGAYPERVIDHAVDQVLRNYPPPPAP
jgi:hypothetical protein